MAVGSLAVVGIFLFAFSRPASLEITPPVPPPKTAEPTPATSTPSQTPEVNLRFKDKNTLSVEWKNLPDGTSLVNIFKSPIKKNLWTKWKTVSAGAGSGAGEITVGTKENLSSNSYYFQTVSASGDTLYTSPAAQPQTSAGSPGGQPPAAPIGGFNLTMAETSTSTPPTTSGQYNLANTSTQGNTTPTTQYNLSNTSTSTPATTTSPATSSSQSTTTLGNLPTSSVTVFMKGIYYSPQGIPTGSGVQDADFWVLHVNQYIEIGWQNLPSSTNALIIYRSSSLTGPWIQVVEQTSVDSSMPSFIRLVDSAINIPHYYKMEALATTMLLATYGPAFLPALQ